ncbi:hypothetical protein WHW08_28365 [Klebsiella pneumoniae]
MYRQCQCDAVGAGKRAPWLGQSVLSGVAGAGKEISTRPFQLVTGRVWKKARRSAAWKGAYPVAGMVEDAMSGKIELAPFVTHTMELDKIIEAFDLMPTANPSAQSFITDNVFREILWNGLNITSVSAAARKSGVTTLR